MLHIPSELFIKVCAKNTARKIPRERGKNLSRVMVTLQKNEFSPPLLFLSSWRLTRIFLQKERKRRKRKNPPLRAALHAERRERGRGREFIEFLTQSKLPEKYEGEKRWGKKTEVSRSRKEKENGWVARDSSIFFKFPKKGKEKAIFFGNYQFFLRNRKILHC